MSVHPDIAAVLAGERRWCVVTADCLQVLPTIPAGSVDAVVTDPPYGTGWVRGGAGVGEFNARHERPEWDRWDTRWLGRVNTQRYAVFCPLYRAVEIEGTRLYYHKSNPRPGGPTRECLVVNPIPWHMEQWEFTAYNGDAPNHPCEKPLDLMLWAVRCCEGGTILDPFAGSGTTGVACILTGRRFIGIEIDPGYAEIARRRCREAEESQALFAPVAPEPVTTGALFDAQASGGAAA